MDVQFFLQLMPYSKIPDFASWGIQNEHVISALWQKYLLQVSHLFRQIGESVKNSASISIRVKLQILDVAK